MERISGQSSFIRLVCSNRRTRLHIFPIRLFSRLCYNPGIRLRPEWPVMTLKGPFFLKPLYFAPLEGIGNHIYRNAFCRHYSGVDRFYTPFIDINADGGMKQRSINDILPENNPGITLIPQILTKNAAALKNATAFFRTLGYTETNLNLGCPSPTVTKKGKGAGLLAVPAALRLFLEQAFETARTGLSIKMRIGISSEDEWEPLLEAIRPFPVRELIIHPRLQTEFYRGPVHEDIFRRMYDAAPFPVCVNPGIRSPQDYRRWENLCPDLSGIMIGRPLVADPGLAERIRSGQESGFDRNRFFAFHDDLLESYRRVLSGDTPVLFKMKELWDFWENACPVDGQIRKKISKAQKLSEYEALIRQIR